MAKIIFDLSGNSGLVEKYQGDIDGVPNPNIRYQGEGGQMAEGIINPLRRTGFTSASNTNYDTLEDGLMIGSFVYDTDNDNIYAAEIGTKIYNISDINNPSYTTTLEVSDQYKILDMDLYEANGVKSLVFTANYNEVTKKNQLGDTPEDRYDYWSLAGDDLLSSPLSLGYGRGYFVAGYGDRNTLSVSKDGKNWTSISGVSGQSGVGFVGFLNNRWIVAGFSGTNRIAYSTDLSSFSSVTTGDSQQWTGGAYGNGTYVLVSDVAGSKNVAYSTNGTSWTTILVSGVDFSSVTFGEGIFVAVGASGAIYTSADGVTWTSRTSPSSNSWESVTYGNGTFVAVSNLGPGRVIYSPDGITWTAVTATDGTNLLKSIEYGDGNFMASGNNADVYNSTDGISWSKLSVPELLEGDQIKYGNGFFLCIGAGSGSVYRTYVSTLERESLSPTKNKATVGFISLEENKGLYSVNSPVKVVYPTTYDFQSIRWDNAQTIVSTSKKLGQKILKPEFLTNISKVRIGLISNVAETTTLKISLHDSEVPETNLVYSTTLEITPTDSPTYKEYFIDFGTLPDLTDEYYACLTIEMYNLVNTTEAGEVQWISTPINSPIHEKISLYDTSWADEALNVSFDFSVVETQVTDWTSKYITNAFEIDINSESNFIRKADNGFLYWFTDNYVHSIDGGVSAGSLGILRKNLLLFPAYLTITDAVDARSRMFIAIQSSLTPSNNISTSANIIGVYIWDRLSSVTNFRDFIAIQGIKEIKTLFIDSTGVVNAICISNDNFTQLRQYTGSEFKLIKTMATNAYPSSQRAIGIVNNMTYWFGSDGILYLYGAPTVGGGKELYKFAELETAITESGAVVTAGNSSDQAEIKIVVSYKTATEEGIKIYSPFGSNYNTGNSFKTQVKALPTLSTIKHIRGVHIKDLRSNAETFLDIESGPVFEFENGTDLTLTVLDDTEVVAELSCYINMGNVPEWTRNITLKDLQKGYFEKEYNKSNVNSIQFGVEWLNKAYSLGDYLPMYLEVNTAEEQRKTST